MTESTQPTAASKRPDELRNLDSELETAKQRVERAEELSDEIEATYTKAATLDQEGRDVVADEMPSIQQEVTESETLEDLEAVYEQVARVVAGPHREAMRHAFTAVLEQLALADELDIPDGEPGATLQRKTVKELEDGTEALERAIERLQELDTAARQVVAAAVRDEPSMTYASPVESLEPMVHTIADRQQLLSEVDTALSETDWKPAKTLSDTRTLYDMCGVADDRETLLEYVENIDSAVKMSPEELPLTAVLQAHMSAVLRVREVPELESLFSEVNQSVSSAVEYEESFSRAVRMAAAIDSAEAEMSMPKSVQQRLEAVRAVQESGTDLDDEPLQALNGELAALEDAYRSWASEYATTLQDDATAIAALDSVASWSPTIEIPDSGFKILNREVTEDMVKEAPDRAVITHLAYRQWVAELHSRAPTTSQGEGTDTVEAMVQLVRGDQISAADIDIATLEDVMDHLEGGLSLQYSNDGGAC
jgi:uncharacterized protein YnzC (UPF0291/DUF896 family)